jgi:hypothetical protein
MQMGNALRYVVDVSFSKDYRDATRGTAGLRRYMKRQIHKVERRMAKADLHKDREIEGPRTLTGW